MQFFWDELLSYFRAGGIVMPPLAIATMVLWYALGYRAVTLNRGNPRSGRVLIRRYLAGERKFREPKGIIDSIVVMGLRVVLDNPSHRQDIRPMIDDAVMPIEGQLFRGKALVKSIVSVAPLAGLLGTVMGMIETFDSLGDGALFAHV